MAEPSTRIREWECDSSTSVNSVHPLDHTASNTEIHHVFKIPLSFFLFYFCLSATHSLYHQTKCKVQPIHNLGFLNNQFRLNWVLWNSLYDIKITNLAWIEYPGSPVFRNKNITKINETAFMGSSEKGTNFFKRYQVTDSQVVKLQNRNFKYSFRWWVYKRRIKQGFTKMTIQEIHFIPEHACHKHPNKYDIHR